jgi:hypothetical protein
MSHRQLCLFGMVSGATGALVALTLAFVAVATLAGS